MHRPYLVLVQPQIHNGAVERGVKSDVRQRGKMMPAELTFTMSSPVDVGGDGLIRWLVHAANCQPHKAFLPFDKPAVSCYHWQPNY